MAKPTYALMGLDFETLTRLNAFLGGAPGVVGAAVTTVAPSAPPTPPPVVQTAPPPPVVVAQAQPVVQTGAVTVETVIAKMSEKVGKPGGAGAVSALMAQYNSKAPGSPGPITNVDPAQYANLLAALEAL